MNKPFKTFWLVFLISFIIFISSLPFWPQTTHAAYEPIPVYNDEGTLMMLIDPYQRDCRQWKIGIQHWFTGTVEQVTNFIGIDAPKFERGHCWHGSSYLTHVEKVTPSYHFYRDPERSAEMKKITDKENEVLEKKSKRDLQIASAIAKLESLGVSFTIKK